MSTTVNVQSDVIQNEQTNKNVGDRTGWKAEWLKEGYEMVSTFKGNEEERKIRKQLRETTIKSIYKGGQRENLSETQKEIFIINAIYKA